MKSLRIDDALTERLQRAAVLRGETLSEFIRVAASERADATLAADPSDVWSDVVGVVHTNGGQAERTGDAFLEALLADRQRR